MSMVTLFHGMGFIDLGARGWIWIGGTIVIVSPVLNWLPEKLYGKYVVRN